MIEIKDAKKFFSLQSRLPYIPFTQSKGWHDYLKSKSIEVVFFVDDLKDIKIACWGRTQKLPIIGGKVLRIDGESYTGEVNEKIFKTFYSGLLKEPYKAIEINSNNLYQIEFEIGIRRAGFKRPISLISCPLTIIVKTASEFKFDNNWKRNVKKAINNSLQFNEIKFPQKKEASAIARMFNEMSKIKQLGHRLQSEYLEALIKSPDMRTFMIFKNETPIAARIIHVYKTFASDVYAANTLEARNCGASYFLMQNIFETLKNEGISAFDFGRIPPSNHNTDSIYIFKNASRGNKVQYNGEWVFYKNSLMEYFVHFFRLIVQKSQRY